MKIFRYNEDIDAVYCTDVEKYHQKYAEKRKVMVWHSDAMVLYVFDAIQEIPCGMRLGAYKANGDFVFYDNDKTEHYVFKESYRWDLWKKMKNLYKDYKKH